MKPFLKRDEVKVGLMIEVDGGFTCIEQFATRMVQSDNGDLWTNMSAYARWIK